MNTAVVLVKTDKWLQDVCGSSLWSGEHLEAIKSELLIRRHLFLNPSKTAPDIVKLLRKHQNLIAPLDLYGIHKFDNTLKIQRLSYDSCGIEFHCHDHKSVYMGEHRELLLSQLWLSDLC